MNEFFVGEFVKGSILCGSAMRSRMVAPVPDLCYEGGIARNSEASRSKQMRPVGDSVEGESG